MKYIVLSFDDGFLDFKLNALPVLEKYKVKATLNVVSGYADGSVTASYGCLSVEDIQQIHNLGHEIAIHSDSHLKKTTIQDFEKCRAKISEWLNESEFGAVIPYSQRIDEELLEYFISNNYLYVCDYSHPEFVLSLRGFLYKVKNHFFRTSKGNEIIYGLGYTYLKNEFRNSEIPKFNRIPAKKNLLPERLIQIINMLPNNGCITVVMHSILNNENEECEWKDGAWTTDKLEKLVAYYADKSGYKIVTQRELFR